MICLDQLTESTACTTDCAHAFHSACITELQKFGVIQACPLCRPPIPSGPKKLNEEATRRYMVLRQAIVRGEASWSALPKTMQHEFDAVLTWWRAAANDGFSQAQYNMGLLFEHGYGVTQSDEEAAKWYLKAADQGYKLAQYNVGVMFAAGCGVAQSDEKAAQWYSKAADQGCPQAQHNLGVFFASGHGIKQSNEQAAYWYFRAADQGYMLAQFNLGNL